MLHRDIKSANLFLMSNGLVKMGDFGIAKVITERNAERMSARTTRTPVGTPMYMAPELCSRQPYSSKADMWALGCVLFELCALRPAFVAQNMEMLMAKIKNGQYEHGMPVHYSQDLRDLVVSLLSIDEHLRPSAASILKLPFLQPYIESSPSVLLKRGLVRFAPVTVDPMAPKDAPPQPPEILVIAETLQTVKATVIRKDSANNSTEHENDHGYANRRGERDEKRAQRAEIEHASGGNAHLGKSNQEDRSAQRGGATPTPRSSRVSKKCNDDDSQRAGSHSMQHGELGPVQGSSNPSPSPSPSSNNPVQRNEPASPCPPLAPRSMNPAQPGSPNGIRREWSGPSGGSSSPTPRQKQLHAGKGRLSQHKEIESGLDYEHSEREDTPSPVPSVGLGERRQSRDSGHSGASVHSPGGQTRQCSPHPPVQSNRLNVESSVPALPHLRRDSTQGITSSQIDDHSDGSDGGRGRRGSVASNRTGSDGASPVPPFAGRRSHPDSRVDSPAHFGRGGYGPTSNRSGLQAAPGSCGDSHDGSAANGNKRHSLVSLISEDAISSAAAGHRRDSALIDQESSIPLAANSAVAAGISLPPLASAVPVSASPSLSHQPRRLPGSLSPAANFSRHSSSPDSASSGGHLSPDPRAPARRMFRGDSDSQLHIAHLANGHSTRCDAADRNDGFSRGGSGSGVDEPSEELRRAAHRKEEADIESDLEHCAMVDDACVGGQVRRHSLQPDSSRPTVSPVSGSSHDVSPDNGKVNGGDGEGGGGGHGLPKPMRGMNEVRHPMLNRRSLSPPKKSNLVPRGISSPSLTPPPTQGSQSTVTVSPIPGSPTPLGSRRGSTSSEQSERHQRQRRPLHLPKIL